MMSSSIQCLALLSALLAPSTVSASRQYNGGSFNKGIRADFIRAMDEVTQRKEKSEREASLMKRMLKNAKLVKNEFGSSPPRDEEDEAERELAYNYNYGYYEYYQQDDYYQQQKQGQQNAFADYGGFNLTQYALKYLGCQNIHSFSDMLAVDSDYGPLAMDRFVVFRLCPKETCSNYNEWGCDYNYGEYTIPMEDYLVTMQEYHIQQYQQYCQTCHSCMTGSGDFAYYNGGNNNQNNRDLDGDYNAGGQYYYYNKDGGYYQNNYNGNNNNNNNNNNYNNGGNQYNNNGGNQYNNNGGNYQYQNNNKGGNYQYQNNGGGDDFYGANDDGNANNGNGNDDGNNYNAYANDDMANGDDDGYNATAYEYACMYEDVCSNYKQACDAQMFTTNNYMDYSENYADYFECAEFDVGGSAAYVGPHCRSDGFTIGIGLYQDEYCSQYVGDMVDMEQVTGQEYKDDYLSPYYPKQCISCSASESYGLMSDEDMNNEDDDGVYAVCGYLYQQAAKCNRYLGDADTYHGEYMQEANEYEVCHFTASLVENNYDEYGEAVLESPEWEMSKWKEINAYKTDMQARMTSGQILTLLGSIGLCVVLCCYICYLRSKLNRRLPWNKNVGANKEAVAAGQIARVGSGITMQRSLSNLEPGGYSRDGSFA